MRAGFVFALVLASGCFGEASVSYQGTVHEGAVSAWAFADAPAIGTPIEDALVELCLDSCGESTRTDAAGAYAELETVFGGFTETPIEVRVTTPDGRVFAYQTIYESTEDPTVANRSCSPACPPAFLNFTLTSGS